MSLGMRGFLACVAIALVAIAGRPNTALAQGGCQWNCRCEGNTCGCSRAGTGGSQCEIGSNGCAVTLCGGEIEAFFVTPGGAAVGGASQGIPSVRTLLADSDSEESVHGFAPSWAGWRSIEPGVSILTDCRGFTVRRFVDPGVARGHRQTSELLTL